MRVRWRGASVALFLVVGATTAGAVTPSLASAAGPAKSYIAEFDGIALVLALFGLVCAVMFVFALVGTTEVNESDKLTNFALISGSNAAPWAILSLVSWGFAYAHAHVWRSWRK